MVSFSVGNYNLNFEQGKLPNIYESYIKNAKLVEEYDINNRDAQLFFLSVGIAEKWPFITIAQRYEPYMSGFEPGVLLVPETDMLFIGAGERILIYDLKEIKKFDEDYNYPGFLEWIRYKEYIFMLAELEVGCWRITGEKMWNRFAEPPYNITFENDSIIIQMDNETVKFDIE